MILGAILHFYCRPLLVLPWKVEPMRAGSFCAAYFQASA
jgi:hypothetical protein